MINFSLLRKAYYKSTKKSIKKYKKGLEFIQESLLELKRIIAKNKLLEYRFIVLVIRGFLNLESLITLLMLA